MRKLKALLVFYLPWFHILVNPKKRDYSISVYWSGAPEYRNLTNTIIKMMKNFLIQNWYLWIRFRISLDIIITIIFCFLFLNDKGTWFRIYKILIEILLTTSLKAFSSVLKLQSIVKTSCVKANGRLSGSKPEPYGTSEK